MNFDWSDLAFGNKKAVSKLKATFIAAPRQLSGERFKQIIKQYLPQGNIVLGLAKEPYIDGFTDQPQFTTLSAHQVQSIIEKVNANTRHQIYTLHYFQRELIYILDKIAFRQVVLVNGSWQHVFHSLPVFYLLTKQQLPYQLISPFASEAEAKAYATNVAPQMEQTFLPPKTAITDKAMMQLAHQAAKISFDYTFQTGAVLAQKTGPKYKLLASAHNKVVPYETYAMHHGTAREKHFSPPQDLNHYDTVHAETELLLMAAKQKLPLVSASLFVNLMPCPTCARWLCDSDIAEIIYSLDHSDGYAVKLLEQAGKIVHRLVPAQ